MTTNANVTLDLNDAKFLSVLVTQYIAKGNDTEHLQNLVTRLTPAVSCEIVTENKTAKKNARGIANPLIPADAVIDQTYNGLSGCACGCGGNYTEDGVNTGKARSRINKINVAYLYDASSVTIDNYGDRTMYEITTSVGEEFDRVTRVYIKNAGN